MHPFNYQNTINQYLEPVGFKQLDFTWMYDAHELKQIVKLDWFAKTNTYSIDAGFNIKALNDTESKIHAWDAIGVMDYDEDWVYDLLDLEVEMEDKNRKAGLNYLLSVRINPEFLKV